MRIGKQLRTASGPLLNQNLLWLGAVAVVFLVGLAAGGGDWREVVDHLVNMPVRLAQSVRSAGDLPALVVDMDFRSYSGILDQRQQALRDGVYIPSGSDFVTATIRLDDAVVPVRMRLLEGPADHLGDEDKWGFEVRTRQNQQLLDMQRFYLLDPAGNDWLDQWAFARTLESEGILTAGYQFVRLTVNGDGRGVYALQEGFGNELLAAQGRPEGVIVRFDADLLWRSIAHYQGDARAVYGDAVANVGSSAYQFFEVDAFRDAVIDRDPALSAQRDRAIGLLRALQNGTAKGSSVFDSELYGRFLALVDLWDATQATSLVNLRFYYHPKTGRLEPIGFNAHALGSEGRLSPALMYNDPIIQAVYAREALRISQPAYLDHLQSELEPEWQKLQGALRAEHTAIEPLWDKMRRRQEQMRRALDPVQPVFAYLGSPTLAMSGTLRIDVGNVLNLPVEVIGFDISGATFLPPERRWLREESTQLLTGDTGQLVLQAFDAAYTPVIRYVHFYIPLVEIQRLDSELDFMQELEVRVGTRILGLSNIDWIAARPGYPDVFVVGEVE